MTKCCINGCKSNSRKNEEGLSFFRFPKNEGLQKLWIENIGQENIKPAAIRRICSLHFEKECINRTLDVVRLKDDVVPTLFPFSTTSSAQSRVKQTRSVNRALAVVQLSDNVVPALFPHIPMNVDDPIHTEQVHPTSKVELSENTGDMSMHIMPVDMDTENPIYTQQLQSTSNVDLSGNTDEMSTVVADTAAVKMQELQKQVLLQRRKIKVLNQKCRRLKQKVHTYQNIIEELKKQNLVPQEGAILLEECAGSPEFLSRQISRHRGESCPRSYGEDIRKFALTLNFLSPKAYRFVRTTYKNCLPHPRTLSKWYQHVDAEPGFTTEAFKTLKIKAQNSPRPILCTLIIDEMAIRKGLYWDNAAKKFYGRVNTGITEESDSTEEASECFVMLLTALNEAWKLPVSDPAAGVLPDDVQVVATWAGRNTRRLSSTQLAPPVT